MPKVAANEQIKRDAAIANARWVEKKSYETIASEFCIAPRNVGRALKRWREQQLLTLEDLDAGAELADILIQYDALVQDYKRIRDLAEAGETKNLNAMLGANNAMARMVERRAELLMAVGLLPLDLGKVQDEIDARWLMSMIWSVLIRNKVPKQVREEIQQQMAARIASRERLAPTPVAGS